MTPPKDEYRPLIALELGPRPDTNAISFHLDPSGRAGVDILVGYRAAMLCGRPHYHLHEHSTPLGSNALAVASRLHVMFALEICSLANEELLLKCFLARVERYVCKASMAS